MGVKGYRYLSLISGILLVIFSFMILQERGEGILTLAVFIGIGFIMHGIGEISIYFSVEKDAKHSWLLVGGLISLIFGIWTLSVQGTLSMALALPLVIATWIIFFGVMRVISWIQLKKYSNSLSSMNLILGFVGIILGAILLRRPDITDVLISMVLFIVFLVQGIASIGNFFLYRQK